MSEDPPEDERPSPEPVAQTDGGPIQQFRTSEHPGVVFVRETLSSAAIVAVIGATLFLIAGVWPPMVAVESGSMKPNMVKGDLIFVTEPGRFPAPYADEAGIVTTQVGRQNGHVQFGKAGSVIVYRPPGRVGPPIIHRARFHVEEGENWISRADPAALPGDTCEEVPNCPAPNDGYITKGDNNQMYDQVNSIRAPPVRERWIVGVARVRIPLLGWIRLVFSGAATLSPPVVPPAVAPPPLTPPVASSTPAFTPTLPPSVFGPATPQSPLAPFAAADSPGLLPDSLAATLDSLVPVGDAAAETTDRHTRDEVPGPDEPTEPGGGATGPAVAV
ncbi:MAG: S26 family signal peptidase [Halobaculum sp.]